MVVEAVYNHCLAQRSWHLPWDSLLWPVTLVIAAKAKDGIVVASDSYALTDQGEVLERDKVLPLSDSCVFGVAGYEDVIKLAFDRIRPTRRQAPRYYSPEEWKDYVSHEMRKTCQIVNLYWKLFYPEPHCMSALLIGYNQNEPAIYRLSPNLSFVPISEDTWCAIGCTAETKLLFRKNYKEGMSIRDVQELAVRALLDTHMMHEKEVGPPYRLALMTLAGYEPVPQDTVAAIVESVQER